MLEGQIKSKVNTRSWSMSPAELFALLTLMASCYLALLCAISVGKGVYKQGVYKNNKKKV